MSDEEKEALIEAVLAVLRLNPRFSKIEEKNVKKILRKLEKSDLTYVANTFDVFREFLEKNCSEIFKSRLERNSENAV